MIEATHPIQEAVIAEFGDDVLAASSFGGKPSLTVQQSRPEAILALLKDRERFETLVDITATDCGSLECEWEFEVIYSLRSSERGFERFRLHVAVLKRDKPKLPTITPLFANAAWLEREVAEMFGISFKDHPDSRKLLLPEGFDAFPLRKDYAAAGSGERDKFPTLGVPEEKEEPPEKTDKAPAAKSGKTGEGSGS